MCIHSVVVTDTYVELNDGGNVLHFDFADFPPSAGTNEARAAHIVQHVQETYFDFRQKLKDLPADDPNKTIDPALPHLFWEGSGGNAELVCRNKVIEDVVYDPLMDPPLSFTIRRIYP